MRPEERRSKHGKKKVFLLYHLERRASPQKIRNTTNYSVVELVGVVVYALHYKVNSWKLLNMCNPRVQFMTKFTISFLFFLLCGLY